VEVQGYPGELDPNDLKVFYVGSEIDITGMVKSSSGDLNQFYANVMWSMRDNFLAVPTDCPQRSERLGWTGDAEVFSRAATYNCDSYRFYRRYINSIAVCQRSDGGVYDVAPQTWDSVGNAAWADVATVLPWNVYLMYGDKQVLEDSYSLMQGHVYYYTMSAADRTDSDSGWNRNKRYADFNRDKPQQPKITDLHNITDDRKYILGGCAYGDWLAPQGTPNQVTATAYFAYSAEILSKAAHILGKASNAAYYKTLSDRVKLSFQRRFYNATTGIITGDTQTAYALAIGFNLLPESEREKLGRNLIERIKEADNHLTTGFVGAGVLLPALSGIGHSEAAYSLLLEVDSYPSWLYSIRQGATTIWERWNGWTVEDGFKDSSFNHYSFGAAMEWVYRYAAGIEPDEKAPGFKRFTLHPTPGGGLSYLDLSYVSHHGAIKSHWVLEGDKLTYYAAVPANTGATVLLPAKDEAEVRVNGAPVHGVLPDGVKYLGYGGGLAKFSVGSGLYTFSSVI
jgi:alpha-L-rhamnosidase